MRIVLLGVALTAGLVVASPADAGHRHHRHHVLPATPHAQLGIDYKHNYGPGLRPGTFATYDGRPSALCDQSAASYRGQDGRLHPCS